MTPAEIQAERRQTQSGSIEPPSRDPARFSPVFVLAPARSCSSVVATMIGQHPELAGLPELKLFCCPTMGGLAKTLPQYWIDRGLTHRSPGLVRALAEVEFGDQGPDSLAAARSWLNERADWSGADVLDVLMARLNPRVAVEKSPENVDSGASLERMANAYPKARYIHLTRHPVATQRSMERHRRQTTPEFPPRGEPMTGIVAWFQTHERILEFCASLPEDRHMRIRAEDALNDPDREMGRIAAWLGVSADAEALETMKHPENSPFVRSGPPGSGAAGGSDPGFLADPRLRAVELSQSLAPPPGWSLDLSVWRCVADLARILGYADRDSEGTRAPEYKETCPSPFVEQRKDGGSLPPGE
ncbi:MAG TPA: sulfotransferase [Roseiarcus sp.]|nr:sulfotransferase [Roseiarcus sp.]